jgi:hypothetical protein
MVDLTVADGNLILHVRGANMTLPAECVPLNRLVLGDFYSSPS